MKRCGVKAQVSMEYLIIIGVVFLSLIPIMVIYADQSQSMSRQVEINQLYKVSRKIAEKAEEVYYLGSPSKTVIRFYMPDRVTDVTIVNNTLKFTILKELGSNTTVEYLSSVNIQGSIESFSGIHNLEIKATDTYVNISEKK